MSKHQPEALFELAQTAGSAMADGGFVLTTAESCTGGWIAKALTDIPGSSAWFGSGFVTYSNTAKTRMLAVPPSLIDTHGAVSVDVVEAMASGALELSGADLAVAVSGVAGPGGGSRAKPVGTVCFAMAWAVAGANPELHCETWQIPGEREDVRRATVALVLERVELWANSH